MKGGAGQATVDKLVGNNYSYWKLCMEAYLEGQDLWELIAGAETTIPADTPQNVEARRKWKIKCGKTLFALRTTISKEYIEHVRDAKTPKEVWETLERLFTQKNTMRLQYLENELAMMTQGNASISEYFLKIKNLCAEISELDAEEPISDARLRHYLIRGLRKEFMPFISSVQGWANQPSVIDLENLLSNQEALVKQMTSNNKPLYQADEVLYASDQRMKFSSNNSSGDCKQSRSEGQPRGDSKACFRCGEIGHFKQNCRVKVVCNRCGNSGHIKRNCHVNLKQEGANVAHESSESEEPKWEQCLSIVDVDRSETVISVVHQTDKRTDSNGSIDYSKEWIVDYGCSHHASENCALESVI